MNRKLPRFNVVVLFTIIIVLATMTWAGIRAIAFRVVIIGDSTAYTYGASDSLRGWGQELGHFFSPGAVSVINKAIGGRSSRSFVEDGHWASTLAILQKGDILLISFGTNDRGTVAERHADTAQFRQYLTQYVNESRAKGALPVLISTVNQNSWNGTTFQEGFNIGPNDYHGAMLRVVTALSVPFIDLEQKSAALFKSLGESYLASFIFIAGNTHFQEMGAIAIAKLVAEGIKELGNDPDVGTLSTVLSPLFKVTVTSNKTGAATITASGDYPPNAPITLKAMPKSGQTFEAWSDASGKSLTANSRYSFTMKNSECSYTAKFQGGTPIAGKEDIVPATNHLGGIIIGPLTSIKTVSIISTEEMKSLRVYNTAGRIMETKYPNSHCTTIDMHAFNAGAYFVSMQASKHHYVRQLFFRTNP
jgi:lysophospholipase L1-like esterase